MGRDGERVREGRKKGKEKPGKEWDEVSKNAITEWRNARLSIGKAPAQNLIGRSRSGYCGAGIPDFRQITSR